MNRRDLLKAAALGGALIAGELWIPGKRLISIPSGVRFSRHEDIRILLKKWGKTVDAFTANVPVDYRHDRTVWGASHDTVHEFNKDVDWDEIWVVNPYDVGPREVLLHKEQLRLYPWDTLTISPTASGILEVFT